MRYTSLASVEEQVRSSGNNGEYTLRPVRVPVPGENLNLEALFCTPARRSGYYFGTAHPKQRIVLHFTAGNLRSDLGALTRNDYHVSTPFVIARDGTIYQLFSSKFWSGHIGKGIGNTNTGNAQDKATIGIEISNYGFLTPRDGNLETYYSRQKDANGRTGPVDVFCSLSDTQQYTRLEAPFRGQSYYAGYTSAQYNSLIILLRYLTAQYGIPRQFLPEPVRYQAINDVLNFKGIVSHVNYRVDGKWDIGPAFDWSRVINGVQAATYASTAPVNREVSVPGEPALTSEDALEPLLPAARGLQFESDPYEDLQASPDIDGTATKRKLYALLVGINEYQGDVVLQDSVTFPALSGCVPDMKKVKKYLQQDEAFDADVVLLTDEQATKENVVRQFREHLGRAGSEDVALFFYSGHGTQEYADRSIWTSDTDGRLECLACYFTEETKNDFLLADKELRFLIHELSQKNPHIVALFDCCHSADNTRNGALVQHHFKNITEKRLPFVFAQRSWEQFLFSGTIDSADIMAKGEAAMLPEGRHIQFAASESNESAVEVDGTGVFTQAMLKVLKDSGGDITYQTLASRIRQYLKSVYEQKPRVYVANGSGTLLHQPFLNRPASASRHAFGEIVYNEHLGWLLGLGAIHGMNRSVKTLEVFDPEKPDVIYSAKRGTIRTDTTEITPGRELDTKKIYQARVEGLMSHTLRLHVAVSNADPHDQQAILDALAEWPQQFELQELETDAQYVLRHANGRFYITRPADPFRPLVKPVDCSEEDCIALLVGQLRHISSWEFACRLVNEEQDNIPADAVTIEVTVGSQRFLLDEQDVIPVTYSKVNGSWENAVHIRITNNTKKDIYCSALYLPSDFRAYAGFLNPPVYLLEKENTVELKYDGSAPIPVYFDKRLMWYNWKEVTDRMKFLFSTEVFDVSALLLDELPGPVIPTDPDTRSIAERGLLPPTDSARKRVSGWFTRDLQLQLQNPEYNQVREDELEQMLADERTADFALGLYLSGEVDEGLEAGYRLKEGIVLVPSADGRKGFVQDRVIDLANFFARSQRNRLYRRTLSRFPGRTRIVAEGDSWFQHPLVFDIIDHLSRSYAVFCSAAAGDTLRNYFSGKNRNGEYYLDAIESEDPAFFLISGGGNDILGKQFRGYLTDFPDDDEPEGTNPRRFLKQSLFDEIDSLMEIYRTLFSKLETLKPGLRILVHGYDYPVKLDDAKKGWLGRYMIEKGIYRPGDRRAVIRLILDDFNQKLAAATAGFSNVSYLDVRNIVRYTPETGIDQWYDEIHPTNDGYQMVAMKFMQKIDALTRQPHVKKPEAALDSLTE